MRLGVWLTNQTPNHSNIATHPPPARRRKSRSLFKRPASASASSGPSRPGQPLMSPMEPAALPAESTTRSTVLSPKIPPPTKKNDGDDADAFATLRLASTGPFAAHRFADSGGRGRCEGSKG